MTKQELEDKLDNGIPITVTDIINAGEAVITLIGELGSRKRLKARVSAQDLKIAQLDMVNLEQDKKIKELQDLVHTFIFNKTQ